MIRKCGLKDEDRIFHIINEAARAYKGIIPEDRYHEPYMSKEELCREMDVMSFYGYEKEGELIGVMGIQPLGDMTLIRHAYVLPEHQRRGIGGRLLDYLKQISPTPHLLVGTWEDAEWAISFYEKHGFQLPRQDSASQEILMYPQTLGGDPSCLSDQHHSPER